GIQREALKNKLSNNPDIVSVTIVGTPYILNNWQTESGVNWNGKKEGNDISFHILYADKDYAKTFQIKLKEGYFLSTNELLTDTTVVVINEKAAEIMGFKNPVGEIITHNGINSRIVGVVENFHFKTLHFAVDPLIIQPVPPSASIVSYYVKLKPNHITSAVDYIRNTFKSYNMDYGLDFKFLNDIHESQYFVEKLAGTLFKYLTLLAIIISCLGLIGLSTFMTLRRTKEIGIRKANGGKNHRNILPVIKRIYKTCKHLIYNCQSHCLVYH
ncbi:MAG: hypothetical protein HC905_31865, partial [Bacteroidales bacterium]|nr:hypothetical protein [Bacteroidales bacterium]